VAFVPFVTQDELELAMVPGVFVQLFDDDGDGIVEPESAAVAQILLFAHSQVTSYLPRIYDSTPSETPGAIPYLLKQAELDFAYCLGLDRRPELAKAYAEEAKRRWERAQKLMDRVAASVQQIAPNDNPPEIVPRNVGGIVTSYGSRIIISDSDGTSNTGDF
jgi:hypothetical protein